MLIPIELTPDLVANDPPELAEQLLFLHNQNIQFIEAIKNFDYEALSFMLEKGMPYSLEQIEENEQQYLNPTAIDSFDRKYIEIFNCYIPSYIICGQKNDILELLASYFIFKKNSVFTMFRKDYFLITQNYTVALDYLTKLLNEPSLRFENVAWLQSVLYHPDYYYFQQFFEIFKNYTDISIDYSQPINGYLNNYTNKQIINLHSCQEYLDYFFYDIVTYHKENTNYRYLENYTDEEAIHYIFYQMLYVKYLHYKQNKKTNEEAILKMFFEFYQEFNPHSITDFQFFELCLSYYHIQQIERRIEIEEKIKYSNKITHIPLYLKMKENKRNTAIEEMKSILYPLLNKGNYEHFHNQVSRFNMDTKYYNEAYLAYELEQSLPCKDYEDKPQKI